MTTSTHKFPSTVYAVKHQMPPLQKHVEKALSNNYGRQTKYNSSIEVIDTYYIKSHGAYYQGKWQQGLPNGHGIVVYPDGSYLQGQFVDGQVFDKQAFLILPNGAYYKGQIINSQINGKGEMKHNKYKYNGNWVNGKPEGEGVEDYGDGKQYTGGFINGIKNGTGTYQDIQLGEKYQGKFVDGLMHGKGNYYLHNNLVFSGTFQKGKKKGDGTLITDKGRLTGKFENDFVNGRGKFQWIKDGHVTKTYEGNFKNSQFDGEGVIKLSNGVTLAGKWNEGQNQYLTTNKVMQ